MSQGVVCRRDRGTGRARWRRVSGWTTSSRARQTKIRRALPDALDVMVVCLEGGLSLHGGAVPRRPRTGHRPPHAGRGTEHRRAADADGPLGGRGDARIRQSLRSGRAAQHGLGDHPGRADRIERGRRAARCLPTRLRLKRQQRAEEMAHKAGVKMLFPTMLVHLSRDLRRDPRAGGDPDLPAIDPGSDAEHRALMIGREAIWGCPDSRTAESGISPS